MDGPLISSDELMARLGEFLVCDVRWDLIEPERGREAYESGHIPGAVFVDLDNDLAAPPGTHGRHPLPDVDTFAATLGRLGITPETEVVVYDDIAGQYAARLWWMLRSVGHSGVRLLDGGLPTWTGAIETGWVTPVPGHYPTPSSFTGVVSHDELHGRPLIDARAAERYQGEFEPVDPKAGHIPGAINVPANRNLAADGRFRESSELKAVYGGLDDPVVSCGSGVTACHAALAMVLSGHEMPDVYVGSFSEWSRLGLDVTVGPHP